MILHRLTYHYRLALLSALLPICSLVAAADQLPSSPLYKIGVDHSGIFQITADQLADMGLDGDISQVAVYGYGGFDGRDFDLTAGPQGLPEVPTLLTDDGRLLFYGHGPVRYTISTPNPNASPVPVYVATAAYNSYTQSGYYFVGKSASPRRVQPAAAASATGKRLATHVSVQGYHPRTTNNARAGVYFMGDNIATMPDKRLKLTFATPDMATTYTWFTYNTRAAIKADAPALTITPGYGANPTAKRLTTISGAYIYGDYERRFDASSFCALYNRTLWGTEFSYTVSAAGMQRAAYAALEQFMFCYNRNNTIPADNTPLTMYYPSLVAGDGIVLTGATDGTTVWDVTDHLNPVSLAGTLQSGTLDLTVSTPRTATSTVVAFDPAGQQAAVNAVGPVTLSRLDMMPVPQMVIVTAPDYRQQAERLATLHREHQGLTVAVVEPYEIYNEYSSGARNPYAIRRFMKSLYDRDPLTLRHLLIVGASTYDPAGLTSDIDCDNSHVVTYEIENFVSQGTESKNFCTDSFFGMLEDNDIPADHLMAATMSINVGRLPAIRPDQVKGYVDKVERYLTCPPTADIRSHALVVSDYGDDNGHLEQALQVSDTIRTCLAPHAVVTHALSALLPHKTDGVSTMTTRITDALNTGVGFMTYSGHANPSCMGSAKDMFFNRNNASSLTNRNMPLIMLSTCYTMGYDRDENGIGEVLALNAGGGGIGVIGAARSVQMSYNQMLNLSLVYRYFKADGTMYLGDIFRQARNSLFSRREGDASSLAINTAAYNYAGDPALPLYCHTHDMTLQADADITPLSANTVTGRILGADGETDTAFNGTVLLNLFAPERTDPTKHDLAGCNAIDVTHRETIVATVTAPVTGGVFSTLLHCPEVTEPGQGYRLMAHATATDTPQRAVTYMDGLTVTPVGDAELDDGNAPVIESLYIDSPAFREGDITGSDITVYATVIPSSAGLSRVSSIDRSNYLWVDGKRYTVLGSHLSTLDDGTVTLAYPVAALTDGTHTLTLSVADNAGNRSSASVTFSVVSADAGLTLLFDDETATGSTVIDIVHPYNDTPAGRLVIEDTAGNTVLSIQNVTFPYTWNLTDSDGKRVPDGRYTARAMVSCGHRHAATPPAPIIVLTDD